MRIILATALFVCAMPAASQEPQSTSHIFEQVLRALPEHAHFLSAVPNGDDMRQYAIASATIGGAEQSFAESVAKFYSTSIAEDLLASYREVTRTPIRIDASDVNGARVLPLDEFATGPTTYDWKRLNQKHPGVKLVLRISPPAVVAGYALVRVEVISPIGALWGNFLEFQKQPDESWRHVRAVVGDLWK